MCLFPAFLCHVCHFPGFGYCVRLLNFLEQKVDAKQGEKEREEKKDERFEHQEKEQEKRLSSWRRRRRRVCSV